MAFDNTQPTNTTKIRNLGVVIRPNWLAIEQADSSFQPQAINFKDRTAAGLPVNPTALAAAYLLYCKQDAAGNPQLFGIDSSSNIIQFTKGAPTISTTGSLFLPGGLILKWGQFTFTGTSTVQNFAGGAYPTNALCVVATPFNATAGASNWRVSTWNATSLTLATSASVTNASFTYFAIGT